MDYSEKLRKNEGKHIPYVKWQTMCNTEILSIYRNFYRWKWVINDIFCLDDYVLTYFDAQMHFYHSTGNKIVGANFTVKCVSFKRNLIYHEQMQFILHLFVCKSCILFIVND